MTAPFQWSLAALETLMAEDQMDQHAAVLRAFSVVELWRLRRVCRAFHRWGTAALVALLAPAAPGPAPAPALAVCEDESDMDAPRSVWAGVHTRFADDGGAEVAAPFQWSLAALETLMAEDQMDQ